MSLLISYQDKTNLIIYANLFSATDKLKAFNPTSGNFETITLATQSDFAIILEEDPVRKAYYSFEISDVTNIPPTEGGDFYLIEVRRAGGSGYDRESDKLTGTMAFYWDGEQEVDICGCQTETGTAISAKDIWEYPNRSLTDEVDCGDTGGGSSVPPVVDVELECPDPYITINNNVEGLDELRQQIEGTDAKIDEVIRLINNIGTGQQPRTVAIPNTSTPVIGPRGTRAPGQSNIRVT
jgi:hypothetical protein